MVADSGDVDIDDGVVLLMEGMAASDEAWR